jgi:hypothetical protein
MSARDQTYGLALGAAVLATALAAPFLVPKPSPASLRAPADGRPAAASESVAAEYEAILRAKVVAPPPNAAAADSRPATNRWFEEHRPAAPLRKWKGVLVVRTKEASRKPEETIASYASSTEHEDGPPFHAALGAGDTLVTTRRWNEQRPVRTPGFDDGLEWLVLWVSEDASDAAVDRASTTLGAAPVTRGGFALRKADGAFAVERPPRKN